MRERFYKAKDSSLHRFHFFTVLTFFIFTTPLEKINAETAIYSKPDIQLPRHQDLSIGSEEFDVQDGAIGRRVGQYILITKKILEVLELEAPPLARELSVNGESNPSFEILRNIQRSPGPVHPFTLIPESLASTLLSRSHFLLMLNKSHDLMLFLDSVSIEDWRNIQGWSTDESRLRNEMSRKAQVAFQESEEDFEDAPGLMGRTRLHDLILLGKWAEALKRVETSSRNYLNHKDDFGKSPMYYLLLTDPPKTDSTFIELAQRLIRLGVVPPSSQFNAFIMGSKLSNLENLVLESMNKNFHGRTLLLLSIAAPFSGKSFSLVDVLHAYIQKRQSFIFVHGEKTIPSGGRESDLFDLVVKTGLEFGLFKKEDLESLICNAAKRNHRRIVESLHRMGADLYTTNCGDKGNSLAHQAVLSESVLDYLLSQKVDINRKNKLGQTPLFFAVDYEPHSDEPPFSFYSTQGTEYSLHSLIFRGANLELTDENGNSPLHVACRRGSTESVIILLEAGANPNIQNNLGQTPLHIVFGETNHDHLKGYLVEWLLSYDANPFIRDKKGSNSVFPILFAEELVLPWRASKIWKSFKKTMCSYSLNPWKAQKK